MMKKKKTPTRKIKMESKLKAKEILDYCLNCLDVKMFRYEEQEKEMIKEITFMIDTD